MSARTTFLSQLGLSLVALACLAAPAQAVIVYGPGSTAGKYNAYELVTGAVTFSSAISGSQISFPGGQGVAANPSLTGHIADYSNRDDFNFLLQARGTGGTNAYIGLTDNPAVTSAAIEGGNTSGGATPSNGVIALPGQRGFGWADIPPNSLSTFHQVNPGVSVWGGGEPNGGVGESAAEVRGDGLLNDIAEASSRPYIREWDLNASAVPGFDTRMVRITDGGGLDGDVDTTTEAEAIYANATGVGAFTAAGNRNADVFRNSVHSTINFGGDGGDFGGNNPYHNNETSTAQDDFILAAEAWVAIPAGTWTIAFAGDDGGLLEIPGITFTSTFGENPTLGQGVGTDQIRYEGPRGHSWTGGTFTITAGMATGQTSDGPRFMSDLYSLFFERAGGDDWEIALASGSHSGFNGSFQLLQNGQFGWTVATNPFGVIPEPSTALLLGLGLAGAAFRRRRK